VKVQTENVTVIGKSSMTSSRGGLIEKSALIRSGQLAPVVLKSLGVKPNVANTMIRTLQAATDKTVSEGHRVNILFLPSNRQQETEPLRMSVFSGEDLLGVVAQTDNGRWIVVKAEATQTRDEDEEFAEESGVPLYRSLYETALKQGVPRTVIEEITRVFAYDIDLQRPVNAGDSFDVFFGDDPENGQHDVLFAALTIRGEQRQFYRFQSQDDGAYDYYDEDGRSARRFLMRKPLSGGTFRSGFGMRRHPILRYSRMHTGVDWSDRVGTPILAAGNGKVLKAEWDSGYGRRVEIEHANGYVTTYSHLSAFGRNVKEGTRIRQGQVIGYLGSSGLSTGPHLHYEVMINGRFVDPLRIKLPRGRELDGRVLADFRRERTRIDGYMNRNLTAGN
jgi:murein DD-endopeptidase MepM/ murein hydrolase activator NlpD